MTDSNDDYFGNRARARLCFWLTPVEATGDGNSMWNTDSPLNFVIAFQV